MPPHPPTNGNRPIAVDLFAGAGGLGEGLASVGFDIAAAVELHPHAALTYAFNHPKTDMYVGDIRGMDLERVAASVKKRGASVDVLCGGPPCQGFSTAGKKVQEDPRNNLFREFMRAVELLDPRTVLIENVPGFKKMYRGAAFHETVDTLNRLGYDVADTIVDSSFFGVPQRRLRFVLVAWKRTGPSSFRWPDATHEPNGNGSFSLGFHVRKPFVTVEEALGDIAFLQPGFEAHEHLSAPTSAYQYDRRNGFTYLFNHLATEHRPRAVEMFSHIAEGQTIASVPEHLRSGKRTMARLARGGQSNAVLALPDDLIHYSQDRIPTVREMARLQSFDDDYIFLGKRTSGFMERRSDVPQYTQVGNAVPPLLARALGRSLLGLLGASEVDVRDIQARRNLHEYVQGSSAFSGYSLAPEIKDRVTLYTAEGQQHSLPTSSDERRVLEEPGVRSWKGRSNASAIRSKSREEVTPEPTAECS